MDFSANNDEMKWAALIPGLMGGLAGLLRSSRSRGDSISNALIGAGSGASGGIQALMGMQKMKLEEQRQKSEQDRLMEMLGIQKAQEARAQGTFDAEQTRMQGANKAFDTFLNAPSGRTAFDIGTDKGGAPISLNERDSSILPNQVIQDLVQTKRPVSNIEANPALSLLQNAGPNEKISALLKSMEPKAPLILSEGQTAFDPMTGEVRMKGVQRPKVTTKEIEIGDKKYQGRFDDQGNYLGPVAGIEAPRYKPASAPNYDLKPYQTAAIAHGMRQELKGNPYVKDFQDVNQKYQVMQKAMEESKQNPDKLIAVDQALITLFNKMTDPSSVVRESEYARTPNDQGVINRIRGKAGKIMTGGAGLTQSERDALVRMAGNFHSVYSGNYEDTINSYEQLAIESGLKPSLVTGTYKRTGTTGKTKTGNRFTIVKEP